MRAAATVVLAAVVAMAAEGRLVKLALPHPLAEGETAWLEIRLGVVPSGQTVEVRTEDGKLLGALSPHGIRAGRPAGTYVLPVPADAIRKGGVAVRLTIGRERRAATAAQVRSVKLTVRRAGQ